MNPTPTLDEVTRRISEHLIRHHGVAPTFGPLAAANLVKECGLTLALTRPNQPLGESPRRRFGYND